MSSDFLDERRNALEEEFFHKENQKKLSALKDKLAKDKGKEALRTASKMDDEEVLDKLLAMDIGAETVTALSMVPLLKVAWADGKMQSNEREAILQGAQAKGIDEDSPAYELLAGWLDTPPNSRLFDAWHSYIEALRAELTEGQTEILRNQICGFARLVAQSAGGFLGIGKVSDAEEEALAEIEAAFASADEPAAEPAEPADEPAE